MRVVAHAVARSEDGRARCRSNRSRHRAAARPEPPKRLVQNASFDICTRSSALQRRRHRVTENGHMTRANRSYTYA